MGNFIAYPEDEENEEEQQQEEVSSLQSALPLLSRLIHPFPPKFAPFQKEIDPLDITVLPPELIHNIVTNLSYQDYVNFEECSKFTERVLNSTKFSLFHRLYCVYINKVGYLLE